MLIKFRFFKFRREFYSKFTIMKIKIFLVNFPKKYFIKRDQSVTRNRVCYLDYPYPISPSRNGIVFITGNE